MECPKCHFDHPQQTTECLKCGVIFAKYLAFQQETAATAASATAVATAVAPTETQSVAFPKPTKTRTGPPPEEVLAERRAHTEFQCRIYALPAALAFGWIVHWATPTLAAFLEMWCHESGHAVAGWLCGHPSVPTAWFTIIGDKAIWAPLVLGGGLIAGGYVAYRRERWFWVAICAVAMAFMILGNMQTDVHAQMIWTFWGEGGGLVLSAVLMMTFYARPNSPITRQQLRWALVIIGAIAFWDAYSRWAGGFENIANFLEDTDERGPSDMMQLTLTYGWSTYKLIHTYRALGNACLAALAVAYAAGLMQKDRLKGFFLQVGS